MVLHMRRVQIQLTDDQLDALRRQAYERGEGVATLVRHAVDAWIANSDRAQRVERAVQAIGGFHSGLHDVAERHDDYLAEDYRT
jgi:hypothetical protein